MSLSPPPRFKMVGGRDSPEYEDKPKQKLTYRERYELEHTYAAYKGQRHGKSKQER